MKKQLFAASLVLGLGTGMVAETYAQTNPNQLIAQRKGAMNLQVKYFGPVLAMSQGRAPYDARIVQRNVEYLMILSELPWDDFQPQTAVEASNTRAKEDIYKDPTKFKAAVDNLQVELRKLSSAAKGGDLNAVRPTAQAVGRSCNSCHEQFTTFKFRFKVE